ncbi:MAG: hypothetical protein MI923_07125 [Phycisphaerales bacterium]|nr:hypothetical protein [Phycisphaerales bacterium]
MCNSRSPRSTYFQAHALFTFTLVGISLLPLEVRAISPLPGDTNADGVINGDDISRFVWATVVGDGDPCMIQAADVDFNGTLDMADMDLFVQFLLGNADPATQVMNPRQLLIGPIAGVTTAWHPAPSSTPIPSGTTVQLELSGLTSGDSVMWIGATEIASDPTYSRAECVLTETGHHTVEVVLAEGLSCESRTSLEFSVVETVAADIACSVEISVTPLLVDENSSNETTMSYFFPITSIAQLTHVGPNQYRTSIARRLTFTAQTQPAGFEPLMEWRHDGQVLGLGRTLADHVIHSPGIHTFSAGPVAQPEVIQIDTYGVNITSHISFLDIIPEGQSVTFSAVTDPPGYEDEITWLSSTKYGTGSPVLSTGASFMVQFDDTWGEQPDGSFFQWLGVRADNAAFVQDQQCIVAVEDDDPTTPLEDFRTIEFAIFRTMSPLRRITLTPPIDPQPGEFEVIVDDGEDDTDDELDISQLFTFNGGVATAQIPEIVPINTFPGPNQNQFRALFTDDTQVRVMYFGENRLRFFLSGQECYVAYFLHYDAFDKTVVGINDGMEPVPGVPDNEMMTNHIILNFDPTTTDADISSLLFDETLRPQGITRDLGVLQVRELEDLSGNVLLARIAQLDAALGPDPEEAHIDLVLSDPTISGEAYVQAFNADFQAGGHWSANGRRNHHQHFVMQTFPAHRLIDLARDGGATIRVFMPGSGVATGNDFSGASANNPNTYFVRGNRMFQATDVSERADGRGGRAAVTNPNDTGNPNVGDITNVADLVGGNGHDTGVMATLAADGVGNQINGSDRNITQIQLGTGKDAQVRIVRFRLQNLAYYKQLELSAADANTRIHLIERSYSSRRVPAGPVRANLIRRYRAISNAGKLIVGAAWNENGDVAASDAGRIAPSYNTSRKDLAGNNAFKKNVMTIGYSRRILTPNTLESKGPVSNHGEEISVVAPSENIFRVLRNGTLGTTPGTTSFAVPLVAGAAAEMMLVDPALQQAANIVKVAEMIEATADDIEAVGKDNNSGHGRISYWKAVLAAANKGLSAEGRTAIGGGNNNDNFFKNLPLLDDSGTDWYGFEIRTNVKNAVLWFKDNTGVFSKVQDTNQSRPTIAGADDDDILTYVSTQSHRQQTTIASGNVTAINGNDITINQNIGTANQFKDGTIKLFKADDTPLGVFTVTGNTTGATPKVTLSEAAPAMAAKFRELTVFTKILPSLPFTPAELTNASVRQTYLGRFSIKKAMLQNKTNLLALPIGKNPTNNPNDIIFDLPINDRTDLRRAQKATGANKTVIKAMVKEFDDFVFHIDHRTACEATLGDANGHPGNTVQLSCVIINRNSSNTVTYTWSVSVAGAPTVTPQQNNQTVMLAADEKIDIPLMMDIGAQSATGAATVTLTVTGAGTTCSDTGTITVAN